MTGSDTFLASLRRALNPPQLEAVTYGDGPLLVLAGAGSGKTRVLTFRIAYLVGYAHVPPECILAVTFTNKAAGEMKERLIGLLGDSAARMWVGTFHSLFARILRRHLDTIGLRTDFTIFDSDDSLRLVKRVCEEVGVSASQHPPQQIRSSISRAKNDLVSPSRYRSRARGPYEFAVADVYERYESGLRDNNAADFDDLLILPIRLFSERPDIQEVYRRRFDHILVDEYQDTNHAQYVLLKGLVGERRNICVVGDDDQSIYRWRGAQVRNILGFESDFPDARTVWLEQNYRSTASILHAASSVVANNQSRKEKKLWTDREPGAPVMVVDCMDEQDEAYQVAVRVADLATKGLPFGAQAVLYRINAQSRALEEAFRRAGIPYRIVGGIRFYERKEIKDLLAYLRIVANPRDEISLLRILNVPPRGVGDKTRETLRQFAVSRGISLYEALLRSDDAGDIAGKAQRGLKTLADLFRTLEALRERVPVGELVATLERELSLIELYSKEHTVEAEGRAENIQEFLTATATYTAPEGDDSLRAFLEEVALITDIDETELGGSMVTMMTLHCAKGLEFPVVYVVGLEDGLLPWHRSLGSPEELEEERRLLYVGMTRAQERLFLTWARFRYQGGFAMGGGRASRFLAELPPECVENRGGRRVSPRIRPSHFARQARPVPPGPTEPGEAVLDYETSQLPVGGILAMGKLVDHPEWGTGMVVGRHGEGRNLQVDVRFADGKVRRLKAYGGALQVRGG
ncbi:UvrD-helicase domain-containing protein [Candidatus Fermentibacteria bacterium]|nr:UvrD-helicase domain-containing protein [Candidatus Fermentibacteria bacterium]